MTSMQNPSGEHTHFDAICAEVGEWDALPTFVTAPPAGAEDLIGVEDEPVAPAEDRDTELDGLIFAGLVSPY